MASTHPELPQGAPYPLIGPVEDGRCPGANGLSLHRSGEHSFDDHVDGEAETYAVLEHRAAAFIYLVPPGEVISDTALNLWAQQVAPAVREAIARG